jgi:cobaltochelatase CobN
VKITIIVWDNYAMPLRHAAIKEGLDVEIFTVRGLEDIPDKLEAFKRSAMRSEIIVLNRTSHGFWDDLESFIISLRSSKKVISFGGDPTYWSWTSVEPRIAIDAYRYLTNGGEENCRRMLVYLESVLGGSGKEVLPPLDIPWEGIVHCKADRRIFETMDEYLGWYQPRPGAPWVGVLISRSTWMSEDTKIEDEVIRSLERAGCNVIPVFSMSSRNDERGSRNIGDTIEHFLTKDGKPCVDAIVKVHPFSIGNTASHPDRPAGDFLADLNVPVFQPIVSSTMPLEEWRRSSGIVADISWSVALPEFEGVIEPLMLGASKVTIDSDYDRTAIPERCSRLAERVLKRIEMGRKPVKDRKYVFFLNNNPCAGVEANVGGAAHFDSLESVARILNKMNEAGLSVTPPKDGKELIQLIMDRKAISEFRWTTVEAIDRCGGIIHKMSVDEYDKYFSTLSPEVREKVNATWGEPPGKGMVLDGEIIITGVSFGNAIVAVQPKRGCYGARCDGEVCKILHDPECPPTHQYLATYHYYGDVFGADAFVHVGTHGSLEFLPGKGVGLSGDCFPDIGIGKTPNLYIYNSDNPPEGTTAKRRSLATLIDHMQCVMMDSALYDKFQALDDLLAQYETARTDPAHSHALRHMIADAVNKANLTEIDVSAEVPMDALVRRCHEELSRLRNTQMDSGMHIFGELPEGEKRVHMIDSILKYDCGKGTLRGTMAQISGLDLGYAFANQGLVDPVQGRSYGALIEANGVRTREMVRLVLEGADAGGVVEEMKLSPTAEQLENLRSSVEQIRDVDRRISGSDEMGALFNAGDGGYTPPGPSGLMTRGRADVLPSGRNFYSLDPYRVPTTSAWRVGERLADAVVERYVGESGSIPENIAFFWMSNDVMAADGEMMAEIFSLLGVRPVWQSNGQVRSYEVVPMSELKRPRIDVTIRLSGILRDNFPNCMDLVDSAVREVAALDEPVEMNFVRKHYLRALSSGISFEEATARLFSGKPGTYISGVNLAVLASAWKEEKDLAEIYISINGYAYGNGRNGAAMQEQFADDLSTVALTFNKTISDEYDLLGCCCYFSNQGGLTAAARHLSGKDVKAYYGDTREPHDIGVRSLADELRRVVRTKLLNPAWIEGMKEHGYKGASDIMKRVTRVYGWEASTQEVDDWIFDDIAKTFVTDPEMRDFFKKNNPYAIEEISRRLLEAQSRGLWDADEEVLNELRSNYLEIESWLEERAGDGEYQGGSVDIITASEVDGWGKEMTEIMERVHRRLGNERD